MTDLRIAQALDVAGVRRPPQFTFTFDGMIVAGYPGETIGGALAAAGITTFRSTRTYARPRGLFCNIGVCFDCVVTVDGRPNVQACLEPAQPGLSVNSVWTPPAGDTGLPIAAALRVEERGPRDTDVAVVGAGPAGLAAAVEAAAAGCTVTVIDNFARPGGQYFKQLPAEFDAVNPDLLHYDFRRARQLLSRLATAGGMEVLYGSTVWAIDKPATPGNLLTLHLDDARSSNQLRAQAVVLATGAYDRALPFPGWELPGVMTAGGAQTLVKSQRVLPGRRVVVAGAGPLLLPVASGLAQAGARVIAVCEATSPRRWLSRAPSAWGHWAKLAEGVGYFNDLRRRTVPMSFGQAVIRAEGAQRVERVTVAELTPDWVPIAGTERELEVDAVCVGFGFSPSTELARALGCAHRFDSVQQALVVRHDASMATSVDGVFAAGEICGVGGSSVALAQGALAGRSAARVIGKRRGVAALDLDDDVARSLRRHLEFAGVLNNLFATQRGWLQWMTPETIVCRCEEVTRRQIESFIQEHAALDVKEVKAGTRTGMGLCQGRMCSHAVMVLTSSLTRRPINEVGAYVDRPIAKPIPLGHLT